MISDGSHTLGSLRLEEITYLTDIIHFSGNNSPTPIALVNRHFATKETRKDPKYIELYKLINISLQSDHKMTLPVYNILVAVTGHPLRDQ